MKNSVDAVKSIDPATHNSNQTGTGVDIRGFDSAMAVIYSGALTDGTHTPKLQESDDDSAYTDVAAADVEGTLANISADAVQRVGYKGAKDFSSYCFSCRSSPVPGHSRMALFRSMFRQLSPNQVETDGHNDHC